MVFKNPKNKYRAVAGINSMPVGRVIQISASENSIIKKCKKVSFESCNR
jgi:hypothetical protein